MTVEELKKRVLEAAPADLPALKAAAITLAASAGMPTWLHALAGTNPEYPVAALTVVREFIAAEEKADA